MEHKHTLDGLSHTVKSAFTSKRPILHHLNADTSWLLQVPRPQGPSNCTGRHWFNILIDPWLSGSQSDVASWFSTQWHVEIPKFGNVVAVEELAKEVETISTSVNEHERKGHDVEGTDNSDSYIDVVAISHEFTDHCHKKTLLQLSKNVPVLATTKAASLIKSWNHFTVIKEVPQFPGSSNDWRDTSNPPLPHWLSIARLVTKGDSLYYHSALLIVFDSSEHKEGTPKNGDHERQDRAEVELVVYTPHGVHAADLGVLSDASPPLRTLGFLHGLHDVSLPGRQLNLGAKQAIQSQRLLRAKYWIGTHDEIKKGAGVVNWLLRRKPWTLEDILSKENRISDHGSTSRNGRPAEEPREVKCLELSNGGSMVLL